MNTLKFKIIAFFFACTLGILTLLTATIAHFSYLERADTLFDVLVQLSHDIVSEHITQRESDDDLEYLRTLDHTRTLLDDKTIYDPQFMITATPPPPDSMNERIFVTTPLNKTTYFTVSSSTAQIENAMSRLIIKLIVTFIIGLIVLTTLFYAIVHHLLSPLDLLVKSCDQFEKTNKLNFFVPNASVEIQKLSSALQGLLDKIDYLHQNEQAMVKKTAHEVKTPLAILKARIDLFSRDKDSNKDEFIIQANSDIAKVLKHFKELFVVHKAATIKDAPEEIIIDEIIKSATDFCSPLLTRKNQHIILKGNKGILFKSYRATFFKLLLTIVENCINHAPFDSEIMIDIDGEQQAILFSNKITHEEKPELFNSNLGIKIIRELALAIDTDVTINTSEELFTLTLYWDNQAKA